jgi:hypothetical protein
VFDRIIAQSAVRIDNDHNIGRLRLQVLDSTSESVAFSPFLGVIHNDRLGSHTARDLRRLIRAVVRHYNDAAVSGRTGFQPFQGFRDNLGFIVSRHQDCDLGPAI